MTYNDTVGLTEGGIGAPTINTGQVGGSLTDPLKQTKSDFDDYKRAIIRIQSLEGEWQPIAVNAAKAREQRYVNVDVRELRARGDLRRDETVIPIRTIHVNIERELPSFIAFLKQTRRVAIFRNPMLEAPMLERIEQEFTRVAQYDSWERPFHKLIDCAVMHGWGSVEVVYDDSKPGKFAIEYIRHEDLLFPTDAVDIQYCDFVIRKYRLSNDQLRFLVDKYDFNAKEVKRLIENNSKGRLLPVGKVFFRNNDDGYIYVCWYSLQAQDWLKEPERLFLGIRNKIYDLLTNSIKYEEVYETEYPIEILCYHENEDDRIASHRGRVWLDQYKQEAATTVWTGFVNRLIRASNVYASPRNPQSNDGLPKVLDVSLVNGAVYDRPLDFFGLDYPNPAVINVLNSLDIQNQVETNNIAWAVNNRQDSRKTATEMMVAQQQQALINTVQVALFSIFLRHVYTRAWRIVKSAALSGDIVFLPDLSPEQRELVLSLDYTITAAGDEDVLQRNERINKKLQLLPVMLQTPVGIEYLSALLIDILPDEGEKWRQLLLRYRDNALQSKQLVGALATVINSLAQISQDKLTPEQKQQVLQVLDAANTYIGGNQAAMAEQPDTGSNTPGAGTTG